jgi:hypothetical protein
MRYKKMVERGAVRRGKGGRKNIIGGSKKIIKEIKKDKYQE